MTTTITCLLVTNDPDDFLEFSEALNEISKDAIVIAVADMTRAVALLAGKLSTPDYIFVNLSMPGVKPENFLRQMKENEKLKRLPVVGFGVSQNLDGIKSHLSHFLGEDYSYSDLKKFLMKLLNL